MIIEIKGVQFVNKGAELMLVAIDNQLSARYVDEYWLALSPRNSPYKERVHYKAYQKVGNLFKGIDWSYFTQFIPTAIKKNYGLVDHRDVDVVLDASGFAYGDSWTIRMLKHTLRQARVMNKAGKKYIFLPQAFGPFKGEKYKLMMREVVNQSSLVMVRDSDSFNYLLDCGADKSKLHIFPDFTNLIEVDESEKERVFVVIPNSKMLTKINSTDYLLFLKNHIQYFKNKNYQIKVINHEGQADQELCRNIIDQNFLSGEDLMEGLSGLEIKLELNKARFALSSRFHGCVSGLSAGCIIFSTSWSHKYERLYENYGVTNLNLDVRHFSGEGLDNVYRNEDSIRAVIKNKAEKQKEKTKKMWNVVFQEIDR